MPTARPSLIDDVMIAAADLEDAEFERDSLLIACSEAIRQALASGHAHGQIARAANLSESDVRLLAEPLSTVPGALPDDAAPSGSGAVRGPSAGGTRPDAVVVDLRMSGADELRNASAPGAGTVPGTRPEEPDAAR